MFNNIYSTWLKYLSDNSHLDTIPLFQRKDLFMKMINHIFAPDSTYYFLLPELIDIAESNSIQVDDLIDAIFSLRDIIVTRKSDLKENNLDADKALDALQKIIVKVGAYFAHLKMDLNITGRNVQSIDSDRIEVNILQLDKDFRIEKTNSSLLSYFGYEKNDVIGKPIRLLFSDSSQSILNNAITQLKQNRRYKMELEAEGQKKSGQKFQALLRLSRLNVDESPAIFSAYIKDNTYINETKSMLNLLSMALESVGEGIVILEPNANGNILYINESIEKMSGYERHALLGKPFVNLRNPGDDNARERSIIRSSVSEGWKGEITNKHKKGHSYIVDLHTRPVKDEYGNVAAIVGIERDISREKAHQEQILHLKQFVEHIINNLPHFVFVTDDNLSIKFWNDSLEEELDISSTDVENKNILEILPELKRIPIDFAVNNVLETGEIFTKKIYSSLSDKEERYYQLYLTPISTDKEKQLLWTLLDITKEELLKIRITWQNARLKFLENFSQLLNMNLDLKSILLKFTEEFKEVFPYKTLSFLLPYNMEKLQFNLFFLSQDGQGKFPQNYVIDYSDNQKYKLILQRKEPLIQNIDIPEEAHEEIPEHAGGLHQLVVFPIIFEEEILGILSIGHEEPDYYKQNDMDFLQQISSHLAIALKNSFYFNLIELQNKKLFIINSIFNLPQKFDSLALIYQTALEGLAKLLLCQSCAFYHSPDGRSWQQIEIATTNPNLPKSFVIDQKILQQKTTFWDRFSPLPMKIDQDANNAAFSSGLFSSENSAALGYLGFISVSNQILDRIKPDFITTLIQDVLKQLSIVIDQINLFEKVKQAEKEWKTTFDTVNIGLAVVEKDLKFVRTNKAFDDLYQKEEAEFIGRSCFEIIKDDSGKTTKQFKKRISTSKIPVENEYFNKRIKKFIKQIFFPIFNVQEEFLGGVFSLQDITEQRDQEVKIQYLSTFPETNPNVVVSTNHLGTVNYLNPACKQILTELGLRDTEVDLILPQNVRKIVQYFKTKRNGHLELEHTFQDRVFQYVVYKTNDNQLYFYGTEITDKVELQRQLLQTERIRAVGEMAAGVAHDFNNLLATILGRTQLLLLKMDNEHAKSQLKIIEKAAIDGGEIVRRMQEVTREKRDLNYQSLNITELIKESILFSANKLKINIQLKGKNVQLHTNLKEELTVKGNPVELKEVFTNLLLNASDAMSGGGDLYVSAEEDDENQALVIIRDTGVGMPDEVKSKIFNPFFTTKGEKGTGLGLSIAYQTIAAHGGNIRVESAINQGTTFIITLPLSNEPLRVEADKNLEIREQSESLRLLIVDDEPELLDTMSEILQLKFNAVEIAGNGNLALDKVRQDSYDVILTDLGMPEMSGWELSERIKEMSPDSHIILVTGWGEQAREELKHHPYVDDILSKPYELEELLKKIDIHHNGVK